MQPPSMDDVLAKLERVSSNGSGYTALCPAHDDKKPSLSINAGRTQPVLVHCHAGCSQEDVLNALNLTTGKSTTDMSKWTGGDAVDVIGVVEWPLGKGKGFKKRYLQENASDYLSRRGLRKETIKDFKIISRHATAADPTDGRRFGNNDPCSTYNLREEFRGREVWLCEGESDVWIMHQVGVNAISFTAGAGSLPVESELRRLAEFGLGRVNICYDRDQAGQKGADRAYRALAALGMDCVVRELPRTVGAGGDVTALYGNFSCDDAAFRAELTKLPTRNLLDDQTIPGPSRVEVVLDETVRKLSKGYTNDQLEKVLKQLAIQAATLDSIQRPIARLTAIEYLKEIGVRSPASVVDGAWQSIVPLTDLDDAGLPDVEPAEESVDGVNLLDSLEEWFRTYVYLPENGPAALAGWTVATWLVDNVYFAPLLVLLSATKRCGKTLLLDLLRSVTRRGCATSGVGITPAVMFRLNDQRHPTFLIDEAERLAGKNADRELISLLNSGHRRGNRVQRCAERAGEFIVEDFDAFGFRALAAIGMVWDTLLDRSIVLRLERKPRDANVARFSGRVVAKEGLVYARQIARWAADHVKEIQQAERDTPRPKWLGDRECDNWSTIFAVAEVAGGRWPDAMLSAAKTLRLSADDEADYQERLIHDMRNVFEEAGCPEVIKSGDLADQLNKIETAPWGDFRGGDGLSTIKLAALLKQFGIKPGLGRPSGGETVRGYWLRSLEDVFSRYSSLATVTTVPTVTSQEKRGTPANQSVTDLEGCNTSSVTSQQERNTSGIPERLGKTGNVTVGTLVTPHGDSQSYEEVERLAIQEESTA